MLKTFTLRLGGSASIPLSLSPFPRSPLYLTLYRLYSHHEVNRQFCVRLLSRLAHNFVGHSARETEERIAAMHAYGFLDDGIAFETDQVPMAPKNKENNKRKKQIEDEADEDYRKRRDRNNQAVKRSRVKSKLRTQQTLERVNQLKTENELLEEKIKMLTKELGFLKDLFIAHAGGSSQHSINIQDLDLNALLSEEKPTEDLLKTTTTKL